jgi:hypothetical protein
VGRGRRLWPTGRAGRSRRRTHQRPPPTKGEPENFDTARHLATEPDKPQWT